MAQRLDGLLNPMYPDRRVGARKSVDVGRINAFQDLVLKWYATSGRAFPWRNKSVSRYRLVVTEALLQRTKAQTVAAFYHQFFRQFPSWRRLAGATESELRVHLKPIGLWRRRATSMLRLARVMEARAGRFPRQRADVEELPGVGQYLANSISLFVHGVPAPLLDSGMARVLERYFRPRRLVDIRYDPQLQELAHLVVDHPRSSELNWAILDLAALVCTVRIPQCTACPLCPGCRFGRRARTSGVATNRPSL